MSPSGLDRIARELAAGEISRRSALKRLAGAGLGLGAAAAPAGIAEAMGGGCPPGRKKCGKKCCPKNARCQNGRCKCKPGFKKCGKKCVDLGTSVKHCGACGNACESGQSCVDGECVEPSVCGDGVITGAEVCDDNDLGGETCQGLGFLGGTLACADDCMSFDTSGCTEAECEGGGDCEDRTDECMTVVCQGGTCVYNLSPAVGQACTCGGVDAGVTACDGAGGIICECQCTGQPNGTPCDDGNACTQQDTCQEGICAAGTPVGCPPQDACHLTGTCDPGSGLCSNPTAPDGTACPGGVCQGGVCQIP